LQPSRPLVLTYRLSILGAVAIPVAVGLGELLLEPLLSDIPLLAGTILCFLLVAALNLLNSGVSGVSRPLQLLCLCSNVLALSVLCLLLGFRLQPRCIHWVLAAAAFLPMVASSVVWMRVHPSVVDSSPTRRPGLQ